MNWLERAIDLIAPTWALRRVRSRAVADVVRRHYEGAAAGRRTQGWNKSASDANAALRAGLAPLRAVARDLVRNNPYATSALDTIVDHAVGWGIATEPNQPPVATVWRAWAETTACDAEVQNNFAGLQKLVMRTVVESGECLVRRRWRRASDGLPLPMQLQVLEPDFLDATKDGPITGGEIVQGVEFNGIGQRVAYWLYPSHPGAVFSGRAFVSNRVPARDVLHVRKPGRAGQARAVSWFAPVVLKLKDFDEYEDATLLKQKIAACLAVITTDVDGTMPAVGEQRDATMPQIDTLSPGMILNNPVGRAVEVVNPPSVNEHDAYAKTVLRAIATGLGVTYEDLTGDYSNMPFSAARMSRLRHWARVEDWRWQMLIPQFIDPAFLWAMEAAAIAGLVGDKVEAPEWTAPPAPYIEPDKEGLAYTRLVRGGLMSLSEALRERGYRPTKVLEEIAADKKELDRLGLILDTDPSQTTQAGNPRNGTSSGTTASGYTPVKDEA